MRWSAGARKDVVRRRSSAGNEAFFLSLTNPELAGSAFAASLLK